MGIVLSLTVLAQKIQSKLRARKEAKQQNQTQQQQQPFSPTAPRDDSVEVLRSGLAHEHLAASSPPIIPSPPAITTGGARATSCAVVKEQEQEDRDSRKTEGDREQNAMASDEDYAGFLERANQDPNEGYVNAEGKGGNVAFKATEKGVVVPTVLKRAVVDSYYSSDADEPFEVVGLGCEGGRLPDEATFAKTINHPNPKEASISIMDVAEWDVNGDYKELVDAVREAVKGADVRVYRVEREKGGSRVEYWVLGVEGGKLIGVKALGVES